MQNTKRVFGSVSHTIRTHTNVEFLQKTFSFSRLLYLK
uniref:Uncharacterized protein n=1 Tax=Anguilla anguilla TaxID=7936 RepID=A0A0E9SRB6_ANGAN